MSAGESIRPLEWKFSPHSREPASGYASRLAALNHVDFTSLMRGAGISAREVHSGHASGVRGVAALGDLSRAEEETLARHSPRRATKHTLAHVGGETLGWGTILSRYFRFCPHCIAQDMIASPQDVPMAARPFLRLEWMIEPIRSCRVHSVLLAETTPIGRKNQFADFAMAMANQVLPRLEQLRAATKPAGDTAFEDWIADRLSDTKVEGNWLDGMPLHSAIATCEGLGVAAVGRWRRKISQLGAAEWAAASLAGYRIARDGEICIERCLDGLVVAGQAAGHIGISSTYGHIFTVLDRSLGDSAFQPFRDIVRRHAMENLPLQAGTQVFGYVLPERRLHTMCSAAAASGTSHPTLRAIFARSGIMPALAEPDQPRLTVRVDVFEERLREFAEGLKISDVTATTGIPQKHILEFVARGSIPALFASHQVSKARHRIARSDVEVFMERLFHGAVPVDVPTARQVSVGRACFVASTNIGDVIELIIAGKLAWKGRLRNGRSYADLLVDADEVTMVLQDGSPPRSSLTKKEIHEAMPGMNGAVTGAIIEAGHMVTVKEFCPTTRRKLSLVTRDSFEAFRDQYVTATEIGGLQDMDPRMVIRVIAATGRTPAFDPSKARGWIYERTEVTGFPWSDRRPEPVRKRPFAIRTEGGQCSAPNGPGA